MKQSTSLSPYGLLRLRLAMTAPLVRMPLMVVSI
jgi:hypothetical protein